MGRKHTHTHIHTKLAQVVVHEGQCCRETPDSIFENYEYVTCTRYLRLLWTRWRYDQLYHSVLHLCAKFRDSRPFLWLNVKKKKHGKRSIIIVEKVWRDCKFSSFIGVYSGDVWRLATSPSILDRTGVRCDEGLG